MSCQGGGQSGHRACLASGLQAVVHEIEQHKNCRLLHQDDMPSSCRPVLLSCHFHNTDLMLMSTAVHCEKDHCLCCRYMFGWA